MSQKFKVDPDIARICGEIIEDDNDYLVPASFLQAAEKWKQKQLECFPVEGQLTNIDYSRVERGKIIFLNMLYCQNQLLTHGYFYNTENGDREHPAGSALRAYINQMKDWEKEMLNRIADLPAGGKAAHGNSKKDNSVLKIING